jgi:hypothetical protein
VLGVLAVVLLPLLTCLLVAVPDMPYWGRPDQQVTVTAALPDHTVSLGKNACAGDVDRFAVRGTDGRTGAFWDCADHHVVGDEVTVRWRSAASTQARVDVDPFPTVLATSALFSVLAALVSFPVVLWRRHRLASRSPGYRTQQG